MSSQPPSNRGNGRPPKAPAPAPAAVRGAARSRPGAKPLPTDGTPAGSASHVPPPRAERRPEMIRQRREQRREEYERKRRQWFWTRLGLIAFAVVAVAAIGVLGFGLLRDRQLNQIPEGTNTSFAYDGGDHTTSPDEVVPYTESPPVGGRHDGVWQNCGFYAEPIRSENAVHSLEHGAVWLTYRPDLPQDQIDALRELAQDQTYVLVSPYPELQAPIVATAWNNQLTLDSATDERLSQFVRYFRQGPQTQEPGASCTGGIGSPA